MKKILRKLKIKNILLVSALSMLLPLVQGCKKAVAPPVPLTKGEIVQKLYSSFRKDDYRVALEHLKRLKALDQNNIVIDELIRFSMINFYVTEANKELVENNLARAIEVLQSAPMEIRRNGNIKLALNKLLEVRKLSSEYARIIKINDVKELKLQLLQFKKNIKNSLIKDYFSTLPSILDQKVEYLEAELIRKALEELKRQQLLKKEELLKATLKKIKK